VAGAINLISAKPDPSETFGKIEAEYGNYNATGLKGFVNWGMGDTAALRVSAQYDSRDGWIENLGPGNDWAGYDRFGARAAFGIDLGTSVNLELAGDYNKSTNEPHFYQSFDINTPTSLFANAVIGATDDRIEEFTAYSENGDGFAENKGVSATLNWDVNDNHSVKAIAAWRGLDSERYVTLNPMANPAILNAILSTDQSPAPGDQSINGFVASIASVVALTPGPQVRSDFGAFIPRSPITGLFQSPAGTRSPTVDGHSQYSLEATATGSFNEGRIEYTAGVYYFDEETSTGVSGFNGGDAQDYLDVLAPTFGFAVPGSTCNTLGSIPFPLPAASYAACSLGGTPATSGPQAAAFAGIYSNLLRGALNEVRFSTGNVLSVDTEAIAAYGQVTFNVSDRLRLIGGLRYSDESKSATQQNSSPFFRDQVDFLGNPILPQSGDVSFDSLDPQAIVEFDVNDDLMVYASYSEAFRSGGFNASASIVPVAPATVGPDFIFQPEEITSYEAGFKGDFANGRFRLNAAGFYYDIPNQQVTVSLDPVISTKRAIVNADSEVYGFEADATFAVTEAITAMASMSYIDGEIDDLISPNPAIAVVTRDQLQGTPKLSYTAMLNYDGTLENGMGVFGNLAYSHKDEAETTPFLYLTDQDLVSGRIGVTLNNGAYVALWGQNLFDDEYTVDALPFETFAKQVHVFGTPRTYGVTIGYDF
jgi:outer membrane receptor protein involved in Fe transport